MALTPQQSAGKKLGSFELAREVSASSVGATFIATRKGSTESVVLTKVHRHVAKSAQLCENLQNEAKKAGKGACDICKPNELGKATLNQCSGKTADGTRCKRMTANKNKKCFQHQAK